jgi:mono/diheme cytochrome c family protein
MRYLVHIDSANYICKKVETMKDHIKRHSISITIVSALLAMVFGIFVYSGIYNIGADDHHSKVVFAVLKTLRDRSIEFRSAELRVPNLDDQELIIKGAGEYAAMCKQCHLAPGIKNTEVRVGMYPQPPNLSQIRIEPRAAFWVIKHGVKMSAMPGWGSTHDDPTIWGMVAFLRKLPEMSPEQYKSVVAKAPHDHDEDMAVEPENNHVHHD